jgi:hypothetical protein
VESRSRTFSIPSTTRFLRGTLTVVGLSPSRNERRKALHDMLLQAQAYLNEGDMAAARTQLEAVYQRCNRQPVPFALVFGDAAEYLAEMVQELSLDLGGKKHPGQP